MPAWQWWSDCILLNLIHLDLQQHNGELVCKGEAAYAGQDGPYFGDWCFLPSTQGPKRMAAFCRELKL